MTRKLAINIGSTGNRLSQIVFQKLIVEKGWNAVFREDIDWDNTEQYPLETIQINQDEIKDEHRNAFKFFFPHSQDYDIKIREHPDIVSTLEALGVKAAESERKADEIGIVEVPEGIELELKENERGSEWLAEKHRTWSTRNGQSLESMECQ